MLREKDKKDAIQKVSRLTGLNPHVIRIWEKRYGAVVPARTETNRRVYTEENIERLKLLGQLTREGHRIGQVARLSLSELKTLVESLLQEKQTRPASKDSQDLLVPYLQAIEKLDSPSLEMQLAKATIFMNPVAVVDQLILPLFSEIERQTRKGSLRLAQERFASVQLRNFLAGFMKSYEVPSYAPMLVATTLSGQMEESGALYALAAAAAAGWRSTYLGPNLPVEEIAFACHELRARSLALHFDEPRGDPRLFSEITDLKKLLPTDTKILAVGAGRDSYRLPLQKIGTQEIDNFAALLEALEALNDVP